jgi:hypothetical protein
MIVKDAVPTDNVSLLSSVKSSKGSSVVVDTSKLLSELSLMDDVDFKRMEISIKLDASRRDKAKAQTGLLATKKRLKNMKKEAKEQIDINYKEYEKYAVRKSGEVCQFCKIGALCKRDCPRCKTNTCLRKDHNKTTRKSSRENVSHEKL